MSFWRNKKVLITGGNGFLGSHVMEMLCCQGAECFAPRSAEYNLVEQSDVRKLFKDFAAEMVIHCAVVGGGIGFMMKNPAPTFYYNIMMDTLVMEEARKRQVEKFVGIGTVCSYPKFTPVPFKEEDLWKGYPEETNAPYGVSKKMMIVQSEAYRQQYGFNGINLMLVNLYGPRDSFDPSNSHVIPALIRKFCKAVREGDSVIEVWGTGKVSREFVYVNDAARAIIMAAEKYNDSKPVNIGSGCEITVKELVEILAGLTGYNGQVMWNTLFPDGQPRRMLDTSKAHEEFGFKAEVPFREGLERTLKWFRENVG